MTGTTMPARAATTSAAGSGHSFERNDRARTVESAATARPIEQVGLAGAGIDDIAAAPSASVRGA